MLSPTSTLTKFLTNQKSPKRGGLICFRIQNCFLSFLGQSNLGKICIVLVVGQTRKVVSFWVSFEISLGAWKIELWFESYGQISDCLSLWIGLHTDHLIAIGLIVLIQPKCIIYTPIILCNQSGRLNATRGCYSHINCVTTQKSKVTLLNVTKPKVFLEARTCILDLLLGAPERVIKREKGNKRLLKEVCQKRAPRFRG